MRQLVSVVTLCCLVGCSQPDEHFLALDPPASLSYSTTTAAYVETVAIDANTPTYSGGKVEAFSITPPLPTGLSLAPSEGIITGTPTEVTPMAPYTVTAMNGAGSTDTVLSIAVDDCAPHNLTYSTNPVYYTRNQEVVPNTPTSSGLPVATYSLAATQQLPIGLALDPTTGAIMGTPTVAKATTSYMIRAENQCGNTTASLAMTVNDLMSQTINFPAPVSPKCVGQTLTPMATASSGLAVSFSVGMGQACSISAGTVMFTAGGTCTIDANQPGDINWNPAPQVTQSVDVTTASPPCQ